MKKSIRLTLVLMLNIIILVCFSASALMVFATEENFDFNSAEIQLLCKNLTESDDIRGELTLDQYVEKVKDSEYNYDGGEYLHWQDVEKIIPIEVLLNKGTYYYAGKDYAFYVENLEGNINQNVFLIDYDCNFDVAIDTMTFEIKVYGMSYQAFNINGEQYLYGQYTGAYSIVNPNLYGSIYNLHDLNDFDSGYNKHNDNGSIIEQVRVNYHGSFIEYDYSLEPLAEYGASIIFDTIADTVPGLNAVGNVYGFFNALVSGENVQVKDIEANPDDNIFVNEKKSVQLLDVTREKFTKIFKFMPKNGDLIINDYIILKIVISQESVSSRFFLGATFYIADTYGQILVNTPINISFFEEIYEIIYDHNFGEESNLYIFPECSQVFEFVPSMTEKYLFITNEQVLINIYKNYNINQKQGGEKQQLNNNSLILNKDVPYYIEAINLNSVTSLDNEQ